MMPDAFPLFFDRRMPYRGQAVVMPDIVKGRDVLFASPTASGKTEAAVTPLFQRHLAYHRPVLSTVYIAPTKALVNDLHQRLLKYLVEPHPDAVARYTGDRHELGRIEGRFCVLVTPEALDSLQLRRPESLAWVRAVIVDEIHQLHGNPRGQQLRHVIDRIRRACLPPRSGKDRFQTVGMTATLDDMHEVARVWLGKGARVRQHGKSREIRTEWIEIEYTDGKDGRRVQAAELAHWINRALPTKCLVFTNSRDAAHRLAFHLNRQLKGKRWPVHLHFGALKAAEREKVEEDMRRKRHGICVATSTLEIGIDIGDVDAIVLADLPSTVSAFLQRIGRGNRRTGICRVVGVATPNGSETHFRALVDCGRLGELDDVHEYDRASVRFQQIFSLCWCSTRRGRGLSRPELEQVAGCPGHVPVAEDMIDVGHLKDVGGALVPSDPLMEEGDEGRMHTVIVGNPGKPVRDTRTGKDVMVDVDSGDDAFRGDSVVFIDGELREVIEGRDGSTYLGEDVSSADRLARILPTSPRLPMSRSLIRGLARQAGKDPTLWLWSPQRLQTWGGEMFNLLVKAFLEQNEFGSSFEEDDGGVSGLLVSRVPSIDQVRQWAFRVEQEGSLPLDLASRFVNRSRYLSRLSDEMRENESRLAVPWRGFHRWLDSIKGIENREGAEDADSDT